MKAIELLKIDFNKYERVIISNVVIFFTNIKVVKDNSGDISLLGFIDENLIFTASYEKDDVIKTRELSGECLVIRKEERRDETN